MKIGSKLAALAAAAIGIGGSANAAVTVYGSITMYTTQAEFVAALTAANEKVGEDNFDTLPSSSLGGSLTRSANYFDYKVSSINYNTKALDTLVRRGTGPDYYLSTALKSTGVQYPGDYLKFTDFSSGVNAVGLKFTEVGSSSTQIGSLALDDDGDGGGHIFSVPASNFVGFISTNGFSQVQLYAYRYPANIAPAVTNLYLAALPAVSSAPEPASWVLLVAGFGTLGVAVRRQKGFARSI